MSTEVQDRADFSRIRYALCWEDADILVEALQPAGRTCLSIGSAGDNSFALLAAGATHVHLSEMNPAQVACIELRQAAYLSLDHPAFLELLGIRESDRRADLFEACRENLSDDARRFWEANRALIEQGAVDSGKFESYFRIFRTRILPLAHSRKRIAALLTPRPHSQRESFYERKWNNLRWRLIFKVYFSRFVMGRVGRDPGFFKYVEGSVADRILQRTRHALVDLDPCSNPYLSWILTGRFGDTLPFALREEHFDAIAAALRENRLTIHPVPVETLLRDHPELHFDAFNLSNIFEYMSELATHDLLEALARQANPRARLAYWNMLAPRSRPSSLAGRLHPLAEEAERLFAADKAFFYSRFVIEEVLP